MSEVKIPNCPCCDGESKLHDYGGGDFRDGGKQYFIKCEKCGLTTKHSSSKDEVLMTWGKRKPMERILTRLEEKKQEYLEGFRTHQEDELYGVACGFGDSIKILKEECGINE